MEHRENPGKTREFDLGKNVATLYTTSHRTVQTWAWKDLGDVGATFFVKRTIQE